MQISEDKFLLTKTQQGGIPLKNINIVPEINYKVKNIYMKCLLIISLQEMFYRPFLTN